MNREIDSNIMEQVLNEYDEYDFDEFTVADVQHALKKENLEKEDFAAVLSPAGLQCLEQLAQKAQIVTRKQFGNTISFMTPLYIANYCVNHCVYCGFNCKNEIKRGKLTLEEIETEMKNIAQTGLKEILILTGESRCHSPIEYIAEAVEIAKKYFTTIGIEIYPLDTEEYAFLHKKGVDFVSIYQETYHTKKYEQVHLSGPKKYFDYRFNAQERALMGGMRGVGIGALLGLGEFREDAFAAGLHAKLIQKKYPKAEISFSVPRLRPYIHNAQNNPNDVHEAQLLQVMCAYRLFMPFATIIISSRERQGFRDNVLGLVANKTSASVKTSVGGHGEESKGDEQFEIADGRTVDEMTSFLLKKGLQPIFTDYIRL